MRPTVLWEGEAQQCAADRRGNRNETDYSAHARTHTTRTHDDYCFFFHFAAKFALGKKRA